MPSGGGGGKKGGGGSVTPPTVSIPPGLLQSLSNVQGIGQFGQGTFDTLSGLGNWAANIATGGQNTPIGSFAETGLQTGPTVNIGSGGPQGHDAWSTQFNPQTGQITFTNSQTGGTFQEGFTSSQAQQWLPPQLLQQWGQLYNNRAQGTAQQGTGANLNPLNGPGTGPGGVSENWFNSLGPSLQSAWRQISSIGGIENQTRNWTNQAQQEANTLLKESTTGTGLFPTQQSWVNQAVQSEQEQLSQQLAAEGLGSSTAAAILRGQAAQQGAATAGQLVQGNISLAQSAQKLALGGQTLQLGEAQAMAGLAQGFQAQTWGEAVQAYQTLGQMMSTTGALYGIDVTGYSNILQADIAQGQLSLEAALGNAQAAIGGMQSLGNGLGSILGSQGLSGLLGGGAFGGGAAALGGTSLEAGGTVGALGSFTGGGISGAIGGGGAAAGGGIFGGLFSGLGTAGSTILSVLGGIIAAL